MKGFQRILLGVILIHLVLILCSCNGEGNTNPAFPTDLRNDNSQQWEGETFMQLVTKDELLQYIRDNDVGLTIEDLDNIDIEDFIVEFSITVDHFVLMNWKTVLEDYLMIKDFQRELGIMAREIKNVESSDEELEAFIRVYFNTIGEEVNELGVNQGLNGYSIITKNGSYMLRIGLTKNIGQFDIRDSGFYGTYEIYLPSGDMALRLPFCYSADGKFFLIVVAERNDEYSHWLSEMFTKTSYQQ
jgi:hypothetical protein